MRRLRRRYFAWLIRAFFSLTAIYFAIWVAAAIALTPWAGNALRIVFMAAAAAGLGGLGLRMVPPARWVHSLEIFARYLQSQIAGSRQDLETALALERRPENDPISASFSVAHRRRSATWLQSVPNHALAASHRTKHDIAAVVLWLGLVCAAYFYPHRFSEARQTWLRWDNASLSALGVPGVSLITEFTFTIRPPAYTHLESETRTGSGEMLRAYKGSAVSVELRMQGAAEAARLSLPGGEVLALKGVQPFKGDFIATVKGPFKLEVQRQGKWVQDATERQIEIVADQAPSVRLLSPADGLTIHLRDELSIRFEAGDDFGFSKAALVVDSGSGENRFPLPVSADGTRYVAGKTFQLSEWNIREGANVRYYVEVFDNDEISGPKRGTSQTQTADVYSPRKNHAALLERQDRLFDLVVAILGDQIELPPVFGPAVAQGLQAIGMRLGEIVNESKALLAAFKADPVAEAPATAELESIAMRLRAFRDESRAYAAAISAGTGAQGYPGFRPRGIGTLEKAVLDFADLIRRDRMNDLLATAADLQRAREELKQMIADYKANPDPAKLDALKSKIAEIKRLMQHLAEQQMAANESLPDEFVNADGFKKAQESNAAAQLGDVEKALNGNDAERALAEMEKFEQNLGAMLSKLDEAGRQVNKNANSGAYQELAKALNEVTELEAGQKQLVKESKQAQQKAADAQTRAAEQNKNKLDQELGKLKDEVRRIQDKSAMSTLWNQGYNYHTLQSGSLIERARAAAKAGDWQTAKRTVSEANMHLRSMEQQAGYESQAGIGGDLSRELQKDSGAAALHGEEIRKALEQPGAGSGSGEAKENFERLDQAQAKLQERLQKVREKMKDGAMPEEGRQALDGGDQAMEGAREKMQSNQGNEASLKAEEAAEQLGKARQEMAKMKQKMEQQASGKGDGEGESKGVPGNVPPMEKVEIPHDGSGNADRRQEVLKGMREGIPKAYQDLNRKYYDKLVK